MWRLPLNATLRKLGGAVGAIVYLLLPVWVGAQSAQPGASPKVSKPAFDGRLVDVRPSPHRYKVEALSFRALDETGYDFWFADEVIVIIEVLAQRVVTVSRIFGGVDTGESRTFAPNQSCILPISGLSGTNPKAFRADKGETWTCSNNGTPGPFAFKIEMYEKDDGFFHACLNLDFVCRFGDPIYSKDDRIGRRTLVFTSEELAAAMPYINDTFVETVKLGPCHDERGCVVTPFLPTGPEYTVTYRLTRLPDAIGPVQP